MIFRQGSVTDLEEKLQMLCDNEIKVQSYKEEAADFICGKYRWDEICRKTIKLYKNKK
ncbi:MAG: hypothetical protein LUH12_03700 [Bacteroides sp.]|nr:hypothetical protein [Bacteroides sp.]